MSDDEQPEEMDIADEAAYADTGRSWAYRAIRHPSHAATRAHFADHPLPVQQNGRTS